MKHMKKWVATALGAVMLFAVVVPCLRAASYDWTDTTLGDLSQYYEIGSVGVLSDPGTISTVVGDSGGKSYGIYMFASNAGTPLAFAKWLEDSEINSYVNMGEKLVDAYTYNSKGEKSPGYGSNFDAVWETLAEKNPRLFMEAQTDFWYEKHYSSLVDAIESKYPAFDISHYSIALKNVFWSRSVQHGTDGATNVISRAFTALGGFANQPEAALIHAIYAECSRLDSKTATLRMSGSLAEKYGVANRSMAYYSANSGAVQVSVYRRLHVNEPADALVMLYTHEDRANDLTVYDGVYRMQAKDGSEKYLTIAKDTAPVLGTGTDIRFDYFCSGCYSLTVGDKRLTDSDGTLTTAAPSASNNQLWKLETPQSSGGYILKNLGTNRCLHLADGALSLVAGDYATQTSWECRGQSVVLSEGLFYPGSEADAGITHGLSEGNSSFPLRGVLLSALPIKSVTVKVSPDSGSGGFTKTMKTNSRVVDLWEMDSLCSFSTLKENDYTITITATAQDGTETLIAESEFTVDERQSGSSTGQTGSGEIFWVTFDFDDGETADIVVDYTLGETYGRLPEPDDDSFVGWFLSDGTQASANMPVAAEDHTLTARYGNLYTVKFASDGKTVKTLQLPEGSLITAPGNPIKSADSSYTYSFSYWKGDDGSKFYSGSTYMEDSDITYTAVFTKKAINSSGSTTGGTSGGATVVSSGDYLTGITPGTSVSELKSGGYTVYSGSSVVSSGNVGTGMVAKSGSASVTIVVTGDTNGDGKLTITDVVQVQKQVTGYNNLSGATLKAGDINGDGKVTITDVVQAAQVTVGQRTIN